MANKTYGYEERSILTRRGPIAARLYRPVRPVNAAAIFVGGVGGGFDTPARELYPRVCEELAAEGVTCLRVRFRHSTLLEESIHDVRAGLDFLADEGIERFGLVGHSFGGAVVIGAALDEPRVRLLVTLATQGYGTEEVHRLGPRCALLSVHGTDDEVLAPTNSVYTYERANEPRRLLLLPGARHLLDEAAEEVHGIVLSWLSCLREEDPTRCLVTGGSSVPPAPPP